MQQRGIAHLRVSQAWYDWSVHTNFFRSTTIEALGLGMVGCESP